ncbi:MAG: SDR family NAD(P)-dependent oxidoreductase [Actinomycetota bacterium]|jgi:3-hydroxybutyrate dehydrogenase|nr:SDR family NAD(P)-dependent oxidoreductase [Actinomycetota bacterium]MDA3011218.1 SDR family NAD(P)-dependent oxidoreductase [Actinomycetota bacterium]MDA3024362.1 SDR family NAD(P)-dependent oxidoreductase [Actinomycetota bacterium]
MTYELLAERVAVITAGTAGIGRAIAEAFIEQGAKVVVNGRSSEKGREAVRQIGGDDRIAFFPGSATDQSVVEGLVDFAVERFGRLDIAVANAGGTGESKPVMEMHDDEWQYELDLNLNHTFWLTRRALPHLVDTGTGRVIAISSLEGKEGKPGVSGYTANKHAINGFVKSVAREVGTRGVTVNSICPGLVMTDMLREKAGKALGEPGVDGVVQRYTQYTALQRCVTPEEIAALAVFLASDASSGITGGLLSVDGGSAFY